MIIDCFSKKLFIRGLRRKTTESVTSAFENIIKRSERCCKNLNTDRGSEYISKEFQRLMNKYKINHYHTSSGVKCSIIERVNRTFRGLLAKYMEQHQTRKWIDVIGHLCDKYNSNKHRTLRNLSPNDITKDNEADILRNIYMKNNLKRCANPKFKNSDAVRLSHERLKTRKLFHKESTIGNFSMQNFYVVRQLYAASPCTYDIMDAETIAVPGRIYESELVHSKYDFLYIISKIINRKTPDKWLVALKGLPKNMGEIWIHPDDIHEVFPEKINYVEPEQQAEI